MFNFEGENTSSVKSDLASDLVKILLDGWRTKIAWKYINSFKVQFTTHLSSRVEP